MQWHIIRRECTITIFSLRTEGFEPHICHPTFNLNVRVETTRPIVMHPTGLASLRQVYSKQKHFLKGLHSNRWFTWQRVKNNGHKDAYWTWGKNGKHNEHPNIENIKKYQTEITELKNTITKIKSTLEKINSILHDEE